jgi:PAS domain-containing protein
MALKIKNISTRFLLQNAFILLVIGILIIVVFHSSARKKNTLIAISTSKTINAEVLLLNNNIDKAKLTQISDADFVDFGSEKIITEQKNKIKDIIDTIDAIKQIEFLSKPMRKSKVADSLTDALEKYEHAFEGVVLSFKEKGNKNAGEVGSLYIFTEQLRQELVNAPDKGEMAGQLSQYMAEYFSTLDIIKLNSLKDFCQNLSAYYSTNYPSFDYFTIDDYASQVSRKIYTIELIEQRLKNEEAGEDQLSNLNSTYQSVLLISSKLNDKVNSQCIHYYRKWNIILLLLAIAITSLILFFNQLFSMKLSSNAKSLSKNASQLKEGNFETGPEGTPYFEFENLFADFNSLRVNFNERTEFVEKLLLSDFSQSIELQGEHDRLSEKLIDLREKLFAAQQEQEKRDRDNEIRRYINEGLAKFGDIMRVNSNNTIALGDNLIKELVRYLGALQGGMFLTDETNPEILNLISTFAYDRKKYMTRTIKKGDGLVGTCAIEKKKIYLTEVPKEYIIIRSGLGDTPPDNLLLVPVLHEDDLVGVLEIASLKKLSPHEIDLAEQIASSLASTIITVRNNTKTAQLLEKSQQQAAEMAEQEEEMRQNMEELKATQEESARREEEMQGILDAIGSSFFVIEYTVDGSVSHVNDRLAKFLNEPYESLIGKKHYDIFSSSSLLTSKLFHEITEKKESKNIVEKLNWGSKVYKYTHNLSPVSSKYGDVIKIINILSIDEEKVAENKR